MESIRVSDLPDSHALKNQLESITEEVIGLRPENKKRQKTLDRVQKTPNNAENFLEQLCSGNGQQNIYTESTNTYKRKKQNSDLTSEDKIKYYVCVKHVISRSQQLEELFKSKLVIILLKPKTGQYQLGIFED